MMGDPDEDELAEGRRLFGILPADERPANDIETDNDALVARVFERIRAEARGGEPLVPEQPGPARERANARWSAKSRWLAAAASVVLIVVLALIQTINQAPSAVAGTPEPLRYSLTQPGSVREAAAAGEVLTSLSRHVVGLDNPPAPADRPVQFVTWYGWNLAYTTSEVGTGALVVPTTTQLWLAPDGSGRITQQRSAPINQTGGIDPAQPATPGGEQASDEAPPGTFDPTVPARLPRDPAALRQSLFDLLNGIDCTDRADQLTLCLMPEARRLYAQYVIPPDLAAAIWAVLADEPDLKYLGTTTDRLGRAAEAIAYETTGTESSEVNVLLIDPENGQLIGTETVTLWDTIAGIDRLTVTGFETYTARTWVAAIGDTATR